MDTTGWDPSLQRGYDEADDYDRATGCLGEPLLKTRALQRIVTRPRSNRLAVFAIRFAVAALMFWFGATCGGCTPTQRKATLAVASTTVLAVDWKQSAGYVRDGRESNPMLSAGFPTSVYFPLVMAANLAFGMTPWGEGSMAVMTGVEGHQVWSNVNTP